MIAGIHVFSLASYNLEGIYLSKIEFIQPCHFMLLIYSILIALFILYIYIAYIYEIEIFDWLVNQYFICNENGKLSILICYASIVDGFIYLTTKILNDYIS